MHDCKRNQETTYLYTHTHGHEHTQLISRCGGEEVVNHKGEKGEDDQRAKRVCKYDEADDQHLRRTENQEKAVVVKDRSRKSIEQSRKHRCRCRPSSMEEE